MHAMDPIRHSHDLDIDAALDFIDTAALERGLLVDHLETAGDAIDWLQDHRLVHGPIDPELAALKADGPAGDAALRRVRSVREALREVVRAAVERGFADPRALDEVNRALAARQRLVLVSGDGDLVLGHRHDGDPLDDVLGRIAERVARVVTGHDAERLRICANDTCRWVFFDSSPTHRRRWCEMASCGNRAKAARHRARLRATGTALAAPASR
ncbi:MAG: CGNR zinc finger domain-containing protein [Chloroflexi bacterium]|nr:CGNR zinc finger domain-containing protein [Chloroflexota bacterium]